MAFLFKTDPFAHQLKALEDSADAEAWALLMSMRTGKSKVILDTATHLYGKGKIDAVVVIAPNGVHRNWIANEVTSHLPDEVARIPAFWRGLKTKTQEKEWNYLYARDSIPLRIATMNYEAAITDKGKAELKKLLTTFRCLFVLDESHRIKTPGAKRTKLLLAAAKYAPYRRILTGTFLTQGPLDTYAQLRFLDPEITGFSTYTAFRSHFAQTEYRLMASGRGKMSGFLKRQGIDPESVPLNAFLNEVNVRKAGLRMGRDYFEEVVGYEKLEELQAAIAPYSTLVRAEDCTDLPPKVFERIPVDLTPEQKRVYKELAENAVASLMIDADPKPPSDMSPEELIIWFLEGGDKVRADNALTKLLRLQQVVGGFATTEEGEIIPLASKRLPALLDTLEGTDGKALIWARFRPELIAITDALKERYGSDAVVRYYGGVPDDERAEAVRRFDEDPACRFFVGNPKSGGIGLPLHAADTMVYFSNGYELETRLQSEERASKVGKAKSILILDMVTPGTTDVKVQEALARKRLQAEDFYEGLASVDSTPEEVPEMDRALAADHDKYIL